MRNFNAAQMHERWCQCKRCENKKNRPVYCGNEQWTHEEYCEVHGLFKGYCNGWYTAKLPPIGCRERISTRTILEDNAKVDVHNEYLFAEYLCDKLGERRDK